MVIPSRKMLKRLISFIMTVCFVATSAPARAIAGADNLRPQAAKESPRVASLEKAIDGAKKDGGAVSRVLVLSNLISLLEGAMTGGYNVEHAISDGSQGGIFNHSEPRARLEITMQNLLLATRDLMGQGASEKTITDNWKAVLQTANLSKDEIGHTMAVLDIFKGGKRDKVLIDFLSRSLVNKVVNAQLKTMVTYGDKGDFKQVVLCVGETRAQYDAKLTQGVLYQDITEILEGISAEDAAKIGLRIAYEPRWAINQTPAITPANAEIQAAHRFIKDTTKKALGAELEVDYGGSLNEKNCAEILALPDVNGGLIGGAAKDTKKLAVIIDTAIALFDAQGKMLNIGMNWKAEDASTKLEPLANFVELFKTKDISKARVVISTPQVKVVGAAMAQLAKDMTASDARAEALVARLEKSLTDPAARAKAIADIAALSPVMKDFMDLFLIKETGRIDPEQLSALKSRLVKAFAPEKAATRIAVYGANSVARNAMKEIVRNNYDNLELVTVVGKPIDQLVPAILVDSQQGSFNGRGRIAKDLLYLGDQEQAIRVFDEKALTSATKALPWAAFGIDAVIIDEDSYAKIAKDIKDTFGSRAIKVIVSRKAGDGFVTYIPGLTKEEDVQKAAQVNVMATAQTAAILGTKVVGTLGRLQWVSPAVGQSWYDQVPPTYKIPGSYQTGHFEDKAFSDTVAKALGIDAGIMSRTTVIKTQVSHGQMIELTIGVDGKITKDQVKDAFKKFAATSDVLGMPEKGVVLSTNVVWGDKMIRFAADSIYVQEYPGGTIVKIGFDLDEDMAQVDHILKVASGASAGKESQAKAESKEEYASSDFMAHQAQVLKDKAAADVAAAKAKAQAKVAEFAKMKTIVGKGQIAVQDDQPLAGMQEFFGAVRYLTAGQIGDRIGLLKAPDGTAVGVFSYQNGVLVGSSVLTPASLEATQDTMMKYYSALRDVALTQSFKNGKTEVEVIDVYRPEEKLRVRFGVSAADPKKTVYKSVDQMIGGQWVALSEPNTVIDPSDFDGKYVSVVNGAGGRIGSLWVRAASDLAKKNMRIVAMGGPTAKELAEFLDKGDTVQGRFAGTIKYGTDWIELNGKRSIIFSSRAAKTFREPESYPWGTFLFAGVRVHVAVDATGNFTTADQLSLHRKAGALRAWVTAPGSGAEFDTRTFVMNINQDKYNPATDFVGSTASCTTGCFTQLSRTVELAIAIKSGKLDPAALAAAVKELKQTIINAAITKDIQVAGVMTTYHALTEEALKADEVADAKKVTRKRDASENILRTKTGAKDATKQVARAQVDIDGHAVRFPTDVGSLVIPNFVISGTYSKAEIIEAATLVEQAARGVKLADVYYSGQIKLINELRTMMATISPEKTDVVNFVNGEGTAMTMVKLPGWYENERYYALEAVDFNYYEMRRKETVPQVKMSDDGRLMFAKSAARTDGGVTAAVPYIKDMKAADLKGKKVLIRVDFNVSDDTGKIKSTKRIKEAIPTLRYLVDNGATVVLMSHNGRPKGEVKAALSMGPVAQALDELINANGAGVKVNFIAGSITDKGLSDGVKEKIADGAINVLENTRFFKGEEKNDEAFSRKLADLADNYMFIFDAFGTAERTHSSTGGCARFMQKVALGFLMEKEDTYLQGALDNLYGLIIGGGPKVSEKVPVVENVIPNIAPGGFLVIGTGPAPAFLKVMYGIELGQKPSAQDIRDAKKILRRAEKYGVRVILPADFVVSDKNIAEKANEKGENWIDLKQVPAGAKVFTVTLEELKAGYFALAGSGYATPNLLTYSKDLFIYDTGKLTRAEVDATIKSTPKGKAVFYNGQPGVEEIKEFAGGSKAIGKSLVDATAAGVITVVGGGDTTKSAEKTKVEVFDGYLGMKTVTVAEMVTHCSTGGGASAAFLKGEKLQVIKTLQDIQANIAAAQNLGVDKEDLMKFKSADAKVYDAQAGAAFTAFVGKVGGKVTQSGDTATAKLEGVQISDSRGKPTVRAVLTIGDITTIGEVPAGASKGEDEARTVGAAQAIKNINDILLPMIKESGMDLRRHEDLIALEEMIIARAGDNFKDIGADATVPVSWALWQMAAKLNNLELDQYIQKFEPEAVGNGKVLHYMNIFNGGLHAIKPGEKLGIHRIGPQEIMIVPEADSQAASLAGGDTVDQRLKKELIAEFGADVLTRADEFGFSVKGLGDSDAAIARVLGAAQRAGVKVRLAIDFASTSYYDADTKMYDYQGKKLTTDQMVDELVVLAQQYPQALLSYEDPLAENDWDGWVKLTKALAPLGVKIIGDDLFVTQLGRLNKGIEMGAGNAILIKVNQNGSVWGTVQVIKRARQAGFDYVVSHRSGETLYAGIADLAAGTKAFGLKTGDPQPLVDVSDPSQLVRRAKYDRMVEIEKRNNASPKVMIVAPHLFELGGVRSDLVELGKLGASVKLAIYGANAEKLKTLVGNDAIVIAKDSAALTAELAKQGYAPEDMIVVRSPKDAAVEGVRQIVASDTADLALAKAAVVLMDAAKANAALGEMYAQTAQAGVIAQDDYAATREAFLAQIDSPTFEMPAEMKVTQQVADGLEELKLAEAEFINRV